MKQDKNLLTAQHILEKEFRVDTKGYRMNEVDVFLDAVISDYKFFEEKISMLVEELKSERVKVTKLINENERLKSRLELASSSNEQSSSSLDLIKRVSELEKYVYKK